VKRNLEPPDLKFAGKVALMRISLTPTRSGSSCHSLSRPLDGSIAHSTMPEYRATTGRLWIRPRKTSLARWMRQETGFEPLQIDLSGSHGD